ncbi:hypothetical protein L228DRAFT_241540 [Xylona heveae TC161]|uniref:Uncharacterized protein n=1 Tax=Xylona heveae (strain CBS 132557 / TC161) TaxID=1328760 RepID=A0A165A0R6_XYLHT|nr:hypothetical protein L228DRAFT_241540 [Xylona heveae TC161]KZF19791.1 hypothetical protein L228DRAFT_241540 [Xylona heveae TC161]
MSRSLHRDVFLADGRKPDVVLGGLESNQTISRGLFLHIIAILLAPDTPAYEIMHRESGLVLQQDDSAKLEPGWYDVMLINSDKPIELTTDEWRLRGYSPSSSSVLGTFKDEALQRDDRCVIMQPSAPGRSSRTDPGWDGSHAVHVFPVAHVREFISSGLSACITNKSSESDSGINSIQNGLFLSPTCHFLFDAYHISIHPREHRVVCFSYDFHDVGGKVISKTCWDPNSEDSVRPELFDWHFRQAVLANMKGAGAPIFENDFPEGSDMVAKIREGPMPENRMEVELAMRLPSPAS